MFTVLGYWGAVTLCVFMLFIGPLILAINFAKIWISIVVEDKESARKLMEKLAYDGSAREDWPTRAELWECEPDDVIVIFGKLRVYSWVGIASFLTALVMLILLFIATVCDKGSPHYGQSMVTVTIDFVHVVSKGVAPFFGWIVFLWLFWHASIRVGKMYFAARAMMDKLSSKLNGE